MMNPFFGKRPQFLKGYRKAYYFLLCDLAGLFFIFSAVSKYFSRESFYQIIQRYGVLSNNELLNFSIGILITLELFIGIILVIKYDKKWPKILAACMVLILSLIFLYGYLFKNIQDCGCFGNILLLDVKTTFLKNVILFFLLSYLVFEQPKEFYIIKASYRWVALLIAIIFSLQLIYFLHKPSSEKINTLFEILKKNNNIIQSNNYEPMVIIVVNPDCEICCDDISTFNWNDWHLINTVVLIKNIPQKNHLITDYIPANFTKTLIDEEQYIHLTEQLSPMVFLVRNNEIIGKWERKLPTLNEVLGKI